MKRIVMSPHDFKVAIDGEPVVLSAELWLGIKVDEHIDVLRYDSNLGQGEIEWCANPITGRKPVNEKFSKDTWSPYCDQALLDRAVAAVAQRNAELKALREAEQHRLIAEAAAKGLELKAAQ